MHWRLYTASNWSISLHSTMATGSTVPNFHVVPQEKYIRENMSPVQLRASHQMMDMISALERYNLAHYVQSVRSYNREDRTSGGVVDIIPHMEAYWAIKQFMYILKDIDLSGDVEEAKHYNIMLMYYDECKVIIQRRGQPVLYKMSDVGDIISDNDVISLVPTAVAQDTSACRLVYTPNQAAERRGTSPARLRSMTEDTNVARASRMSPAPRVENAIDEGSYRRDVSNQPSPVPHNDGENDEWEEMEEEGGHTSPNIQAEDSNTGWGNPNMDDDPGRDDRDPILNLATRIMELHQQYQDRPTRDELKEKLVAVVTPTIREQSPDSDSYSSPSTPPLEEEEQSEEDPDALELLQEAINQALFNSGPRRDPRIPDLRYYSDSDSE